MDKYQIGKSIGHGSSGEVFLCKYKQENKFYVVKKFRMFHSQSTLKTRQCIQNELALLQRFRHTNIVSYKDNYSDEEGNLYIVMMYCEDGDMAKKIQMTKQKGKTIPETQILDWLIQIALAIYYLHSQNIIHRDVKPHNVFLKNERIRLGDFGIAKMVDSTNLTATCAGTPYYMAPEVLKHKPYSYKSDIWSFGCILYEMCNLKRPFQANNEFSLATKIWKGSYPSINAIYSKQLRDLISEMLTVSPAKRPTIVDILGKPFLKRRLQNYISNILTRSSGEVDTDDVYADTLRIQAGALGIDTTVSEVEEPLKKQPSSKDMNERNRFNRTKRQMEEEDRRNFKRKSIYSKETNSLERIIQKTDVSTQPSFKVSTHPDQSERDACPDNRRKEVVQVKKKGARDVRNNAEERETSRMEGHQGIEYPPMEENESRKFQIQQDFSMNDQKPYQQCSSESDESIIMEEDQESRLDNTNPHYEEEEAPEEYNGAYYRLLDQIKVLKHKCQTDIGVHKYWRLYQTVSTNADKQTIVGILGPDLLGYWHIVDQILFYEGILKNLPKQ